MIFSIFSHIILADSTIITILNGLIMSDNISADEQVATDKRGRKAPTFYKVEEIKSNKPREIVSGNGITLKDYPFFYEQFDKLKTDHEVTRGLYSLLYGGVGKKFEVKKLVREFSGFPDEAAATEALKKATEKKKIYTVVVLKGILGLFGLEKSGDRDALCKRTIDYLTKPSELKSEKKGEKKSAKRKSSSGDSKVKGKSSKRQKKEVKSRPLSGYQMYANETRKTVKAEQPDLSFPDTSTLLGKMWKELSEDERKVWQDKAAEAKAAAAGQEKAPATEGDEPVENLEDVEIDWGDEDEDSDGDDEEEEEKDDDAAASDEGAEEDPFKEDD
jgi:hypothetical protein